METVCSLVCQQVPQSSGTLTERTTWPIRTQYELNMNSTAGWNLAPFTRVYWTTPKKQSVESFV